GGSTAAGATREARLALAPGSTRHVVKEAVFQETLEVFGTLAPQVTVSVSVETGGVVRAVYAEAGDEVEAGALLAELQDERLGIALQQAEIGLGLSRQEHELAHMRLDDGERIVEAALLEIEQAQIELKQRATERGEVEHRLFLVHELHKIGGSTDGELRAAETELKSADTRLELAERRLAAVEIGYREKDLHDAGIEVPPDTAEYAAAFLRLHTRRLEHELQNAKSRVLAAELELQRAELAHTASLIHSPMDGVVGDRFLVPGERVAVGDRAFTVLSLQALEFVGELGEDKQSQLEIGAAVKVYTARGGELIAHGRVSRAAPYLDPSRRSRALRVALDTEPAESSHHRPGLLARAVINTGRPTVYLAIDKEALHHGLATEGSTTIPSYLQVLRGNELLRIPVRQVHADKDQVLFEGDVQVGEQALARSPGDTYVDR
ncbi:MAG: efflux RND transporter periplasmic adaptor subunit, partial [Spirochaeta sp.]|nr:efflux RND transporter periplasmic adaptor subunit [Spirochaeta sp.]